MLNSSDGGQWKLVSLLTDDSHMSIPDLVENVLPEGVHDCTIEEIEACFGRFQKSDRRMRLTEKLRQYLGDARQSGAVAAVIVDGSYVTAKDEPEDIDLLVVLRADWDWPEGIKPFVYNAITRQGIRRMGYPFDVLTRVFGSASYEEAVRYFMNVNPRKDSGLTAKKHKGLLRVVP